MWWSWSSQLLYESSVEPLSVALPTNTDLNFYSGKFRYRDTDRVLLLEILQIKTLVGCTEELQQPAGSCVCCLLSADCDVTTQTGQIGLLSNQLENMGNSSSGETERYGRDQIHLFYPVLPHLSDSDQVYKTLYKRWELPGEYLNYCWILPTRIN